jgi:hypothetical protein
MSMTDPPQPSLPPPSGAWLPPSAPAPAAPPAIGVPVLDVVAPGDQQPKRRSPAVMAGAVVGVVALVAAGTFAFLRISGNDTQGGAASAEEVGTALTTALSNEDVLGVIDLLLPGERETFRDPIVGLVDHLRRLEVLSAEADLGKLGGIDVEFTDVDVRVEPTNVDDISNIALSGSATVSVNGDTVPLGDLLLDEVFDGVRPDMDQAPDTEEFSDVPLTVVERDGRWYLSAFYSAAEGIREDEGDIPAEPIRLNGADSPDGAVDNLLGSVSDLDLGDLIGSLDPNEFEALQRYAPMFLDDAQRELDDAGITWELSDRTYEVAGDGARRSVTVTGFRFRFDIPESDDDVEITYADDCLKGDVAGTSIEYCTADRAATTEEALRDAGLLDTRAGDLIQTIVEAVADVEAPGIAVHEVDGQWFVAPMRTGWDSIDAVLGALDADELRDIVRSAREAADGFDLDDVLSGDVLDTGVLDGGSTDDGSADDGSADDGMTDDGTVDALGACYLETDIAAALACFQTGITEGSIDPAYVPVAYRFPECGVAEAYWGPIYSMPDAEFVALVEGASPCFLAIVEAGTVEAWEVPGELLAPQCLEGKNYYAEFDTEYNERFFACTSEAMSAL